MAIVEEIVATYAPDMDMTFILRETYSDEQNIWISTEVVGFYYGEPNNDLTQQHVGKLKAVYI